MAKMTKTVSYHVCDECKREFDHKEDKYGRVHITLKTYFTEGGGMTGELGQWKGFDFCSDGCFVIWVGENFQ